MFYELNVYYTSSSLDVYGHTHIVYYIPGYDSDSVFGGVPPIVRDEATKRRICSRTPLCGSACQNEITFPRQFPRANQRARKHAHTHTQQQSIHLLWWCTGKTAHCMRAH